MMCCSGFHIIIKQTIKQRKLIHKNKSNSFIDHNRITDIQIDNKSIKINDDKRVDR
jgi:hypothetical protein